jgi:hypothetical protein
VTESPLTRLARALLLAAAAVVLLGLVALAAGGYRFGGSGSAHQSRYAVDTVVTIIVSLYLLAAIVVFVGLFWAGLDDRRRQTRTVRRQRTIRMGVIMLVIAVLFAVAAGRYHLGLRLPSFLRQSPAASTLDNSHGKKGGSPGAPHHTQLQVGPMLGVFGAAALAFAALVVAERRRKKRLPADAMLAERLSDVLDQTLDDLRAEEDPRRAVIAAYARMERALAAHGVPRLRFEAPHEYLGRVLAELTGGGLAAARLTTLFERARFSPHEVDATMKADAIDAIEALQRDLAAQAQAEAEAA